MNIRLAKETDFETIMNIYENARNFMKQNGNPNQWKDDYPPKNLIIKDIKEHKFLRVVENNESEICGVFYFKIGVDKTYKNIDGKRINESEYGVIHRIAVEYCLTLTDHIRIDTHRDNKIMISLLLNNGFIRTGIIYCDTGEAREAFELIKNKKI